MIKKLKENKWLLIPLILSLLFFIKKGIQYFFIGSYFSIFLVVIFLSLFLISIKYNRKMFFIVLRLWSILIIIWSGLRILIFIMNHFTNTFDEYHLTNEFGINSIIISLIMLLFGIMIIRRSNNKRLKDLL